jgi:hypothetical protein
MTAPLSKEMLAKRERMIGLGRSVAQIIKATGSTKDAVEKAITRYNQQVKAFGHPGHSIVRDPSQSIEEAGPQSPESPDDVPLTPAGVRAELRRMLDRLKAMENALKDDGPVAMPAVVALLDQQRKTIEALLKAEVVFANMPVAGQQGQSRVLRIIVVDARVPELRHRETKTPGVSGQGPENNDNRRDQEAGHA